MKRIYAFIIGLCVTTVMNAQTGEQTSNVIKLNGGLDFVTSFSGALSSLSNVGPALGHVIGPDKTYAALPGTVKWILATAMLVGRLEFVSVFVLFFPFLWRRNV